MAAVCSSMMQKQSHNPTEMEFGQSSFSLDTWARMANLRPVRTTTSSSLSANSSTTLKDLPHAKSALTLDIPRWEEDEAFTCESVCETPKSNQHRIPDVDVDFCPRAPKKPRGQGRFALISAMEFENSTPCDLGLSSPSYLF